MRLDLRHHLPAVIVTAVLLTGGTSAVAYALASQVGLSPADTGNTLPIDDNHPSPSAAPEDRAPTPEPSDDRRSGTAAPAPVASPDDRGTHHEQETADDRGTRPSADSTSEDATSSDGDRSGSDDAPATSAPAPTASSTPVDDHGGSSGSGSSDGSGGGSAGSDDTSGHG